MDETLLRRRLDAIERRQRIVLALLVGLYALATSWILVREVAAVTAWSVAVAAVALALFAVVGAVYRRRRARS